MARDAAKGSPAGSMPILPPYHHPNGKGYLMKYWAGTTIYDANRAFNGYTLWSPLSTMQTGAEEPGQWEGETFLMDMTGNVVHSWKLPYPTMYAWLLPDGHLLAGLRTTRGGEGRPGVREFAMGGTMGMLMELDWDGNILFRHEDPAMHHDFKKLANGNYAYLAWEALEPEKAASVLGGRRGTERSVMWCDVIREITPAGNIVREWHAKDHLNVEEHIIGPLYARVEWTHLNDLWECENGDFLCSSRFLDCVFRIDRNTGDIVWRWGAASSLDRESGRLDLAVTPSTLGGPHDAHIIPSGLPGAGHMLCYDNGMYSYISRAVEVDIQTGDVVWQSTDVGFQHGRVPFSCFISSARRLPNGNTLCCEGCNGRFYEVTPDRDVVWEYWKPEADPSATPWTVFRAFRYAKDYCPQFASLPPAEGSAR